MESDILVSIIIPVYNAEKFIATAIESVLRQNADWVELILVNDGSKDSSLKICEKYQSDLVKVITTENLGAGHARNVGINNASGKWLMFLDSDDLIISDFFNDELNRKLHNLNDRSVEIIYTPKIVCDYFLEDAPVITYPESVDDIKYYIPSLEFWSCIYNADFMKKNNILFFEYKKQDIESAFRFRAFSKSKSIIVDNDEVFIVHRNNPLSNVNTWNLENLYEIKSKVFYELYDEFELNDSQTKQWLLIQSLYFAKKLIGRCKDNGFSENSVEQIKSVIEQYNCKLYKLPFRYSVFAKYLKMLSNNGLFWSIYCKKCNSVERIAVTKNEKATIPSDDRVDLFEKLDNYKIYINNRKVEKNANN